MGCGPGRSRPHLVRCGSQLRRRAPHTPARLVLAFCLSPKYSDSCRVLLSPGPARRVPKMRRAFLIGPLNFQSQPEAVPPASVRELGRPRRPRKRNLQTEKFRDRLSRQRCGSSLNNLPNQPISAGRTATRSFTARKKKSHENAGDGAAQPDQEKQPEVRALTDLGEMGEMVVYLLLKNSNSGIHQRWLTPYRVPGRGYRVKSILKRGFNGVEGRGYPFTSRLMTEGLRLPLLATCVDLAAPGTKPAAFIVLLNLAHPSPSSVSGSDAASLRTSLKPECRPSG